MPPTPADPAEDRQRLDKELLSRGLVRSRTQAQALIAAGRVRVDDVVVAKASELVAASAEIEAEPEPYVSRGAYKLIGALDDLGVAVAGRGLDAGSSTGGFTQVLLERGCTHVTAVDVGTGQLAEVVLEDPRVTVHDRTNLRELTLDHVGGQPVDLAVADVSFISLVLVLEPLTAVMAPAGQLLLMVKPQFEVGRKLLGPDGVVRSSELHRRAVDGVLARAVELGWHCHGAAPSRLPGAGGNREFFVLLRTAAGARPVDTAALVAPLPSGPGRARR